MLIIYYSLDNSCLVGVEFQREVYFLRVSHISETLRKYRTPAECYVYRKRYTTFSHSSGVLCVENHIPLRQINGMNVLMTFPGAEMSVHHVAINILLRWSKEGFHFVCRVLILQHKS